MYGLDLIARIDAGDNEEYYLTDGLGSTTVLTDDAGDVTGTYEYDAFGGLRASSGSQPNDFTFTGEQVDGSTGLQYLRARYYDMEVGRFISRDPLPLVQQYAYVGNNCVNRVDPTGLVPVGPGAPDARQVCTTSFSLWDLNGRATIVPIPFVPDPPSFELFRFEMSVLYYQHGNQVVAHSMWAGETHLSAGWHIDANSLEYRTKQGKEGAGAMATARFGAGGANPFGFWPVGFNADVTLEQTYDPVTGEVTGLADAEVNPFKLFTGLKEEGATTCSGWY